MGSARIAPQLFDYEPIDIGEMSGEANPARLRFRASYSGQPATSYASCFRSNNCAAMR